MSAAVILLQFLLALLGFLFSLKGIFVMLTGVLLFLVIPIVPRTTGEFRKFSNLHLWLATSILQRAAIVVSEHGDLLLKRMEFDDLGVEKISFGDEEKEFEDPDAALHHWMGIPFALASEAKGVLFDPRHAALGKRKQEAKEHGEYSIRATQSEWNQYQVHEWKKGVFEFTRDAYEMVNLSAVKHLVDGGERAEYPGRVEELYKHSRLPYQEGTGTAKFILIVVAMIGPFAALWLMASQGSSGGGGGSTVGYGGFLLWIPALKSLDKDDVREWASRARDRLEPMARTAAKHLRSGASRAGDKGGDIIEDVDWKHVAIVSSVVLPLPTIFLLVFVFVNPLTAILAFIVLGIGFWTPALFTVLLRPTQRLGGGYARLLFKLGLTGYEKPVFEWTPSKYQLREASELEDVSETKWYGLAGSLVGFTFTPSEESWGAEVMDIGDLQARREAVADGGHPSESNIPANYLRVPDMTRASSYAAFVPKRLPRDKYYLNTGIATGRFTDSAVGSKALSRLLWAKEEYGEADGLSDKTMIYAMLGSGVCSFALGVFVFFL